jgi:hypothetical protein
MSAAVTARLALFIDDNAGSDGQMKSIIDDDTDKPGIFCRKRGSLEEAKEKQIQLYRNTWGA